jgi:PPP family 3-phenylpropionic acid transporter
MVRISLFVYLLFSTFSVIGFFLPLYLESKGLKAGQIGTILGLGALISIFSQLFWGYVSDKRKTVKRILQMILISSFLLSIGLFSVETFFLIMLFYGVFMFFNSSAGSLTETLCISYAHQNNKDFGRIRVWGEVGVGISALLLGFIVERIGVNSLWFVYALLLGFAISATFLLRDTKAASAPVTLSALKKMFTQPKLLWFLMLVLIIAIPHRMNDSMLAIFLNQLGASESHLGMAWLIATLSTVPALIFAGKLIKKWNELGIFVVATLFYTIRWIVYSQAESPFVLVLAQLFHSLTFPLFLVASLQYIINIVPAELRATGQAAFSVTFGGLGGIIGSAGGGYVFELFGPYTAYVTGSVLTILGAIAATATYVVDRRNHNQGVFKTVRRQPDI